MKKIFLITVLTLTFSVPAFAELTVDDTLTTDYMKNHGHSTPLINAAHKSVAQVNGEPLAEPTEQECYNNPFIKAVRRVFMYIDPALDDHTFVNNHDIKTSPRFDDL